MKLSKKHIIVTAALALAVLAVVVGVALNGEHGRELSEERNKRLICLDAGHGGDDVGAQYDGRNEKDDNLKLTLAVGSVLEAEGFDVVYTRKTDKTVSLQKRAELANSEKAACFVSIHRNSADAQVSGVEIWVSSKASFREKRLAKNILSEINDVGFGESRGVKQGYQGDRYGDYYVNSNTDMPSCLVEMGFMTTAEDNELFDKNIKKYAKAIANGIIETLE